MNCKFLVIDLGTNSLLSQSPLFLKFPISHVFFLNPVNLLRNGFWNNGMEIKTFVVIINIGLFGRPISKNPIQNKGTVRYSYCKMYSCDLCMSVRLMKLNAKYKN